ncbi:MAG: hypothetical protein KDK53_13745 [Maritimibacter sp.]|nr:hypothetical protein [Maritimibacter sp.]
MNKVGRADIPRKQIRKLLKKITPELEELRRLLEQSDEDETESVSQELIRSGARNLLIAQRIIREKKSGSDGD